MDEDRAGEAGADQASLFPKSAGDRLREAREAQGLTLADIANQTRVPTRHLEAIEQNRFDGLPSPTYAVGFARAYARVVGLDEKAIAAEVRNSPQLPVAPSTDYSAYEPSDPKRLPSRGLAMAAGAIAVLVLLGVIVWYGTGLFRGSDEPTLAIPENTIAAAPEATPTPAPVGAGQVTLMATGSVWVKIYDATGKVLLEKTMAPGERFDVPADADNPMANVARPDLVQVMVNGSQVAPLGTGHAAIKAVPVSAAALQARGTGQPTPAAAPTPAPVASATPSSVPPAFAPPRPTPTPKPRATLAPPTLSDPLAAPTPTP
ncbi:helix-turn-helix domain-containing protein [Sphingomonas sp.]|jgi:cytoskeletal protein RodZ|uniref:helix-turn-helix domain-containing protein n=1 Tax=Sphingomonas sp. TaxID=28214 RepID=UPI002E362699|nr:RodZ domain-containing protein [Sphingomonas sp.]HEX4694268.1 RodZ domain-containing protein [Sphingomonas sp.]